MYLMTFDPHKLYSNSDASSGELILNLLIRSPILTFKITCGFLFFFHFYQQFQHSIIVIFIVNKTNFKIQVFLIDFQ